MDVTFGTAAVNDMSVRTSFGLVMSGVPSGQPIFVMHYIWNDPGVSSIGDTFASPYAWQLVDSTVFTVNVTLSLWIGTGGSGSSGTITCTNPNANCGGIAIPCVNANTGSGLSCLNVHGSNSGNSGTASLTLTPSVANTGALYAQAGIIEAAEPLGWHPNVLLTGGVRTADFCTLPNPIIGDPLTATWTGASSPWGTVGAIVRELSVDTLSMQPHVFGHNMW